MAVKVKKQNGPIFSVYMAMAFYMLIGL